MADKEKGPGGETPEPMGTVENSKRANSIPAEGGVQVNRIDAPRRATGLIRFTSAYELTRRMRGRWLGTFGKVRCPNHPAPRPALIISDEDGPLVVQCFGGCSRAELDFFVFSRRGIHVDRPKREDAKGGGNVD